MSDICFDRISIDNLVARILTI